MGRPPSGPEGRVLQSVLGVVLVIFGLPAPLLSPLRPLSALLQHTPASPALPCPMASTEAWVNVSTTGHWKMGGEGGW